MSTPSRAVFLSYASEDAPAAQRIAEALRSAGIEVWFDREELRGGDVWDQKIRQQIRDCRLFVPIISAHSEARLEGYFRREWKLAVDRTDDMAGKVTFLVPVVIDDTPNVTAEVPERFRHVQWTRLGGGEATPTFVTLINQLLTRASPTSESSPSVQTRGQGTTPAPAPACAVKQRWFGRQLAMTIGACVVIVAALSYFAYHRFGTARTAPQTAMAATDKSIAVLPFVDLSEKHDQEYFADGMAEELIDLLANIPGLRVIGRTSSFQFKGKSQDLRAIGEVPGVNYVVEGSVRKSADRIRITAQLIEAHNGSHLWSQTYDRAATDALLLQGEIAMTLARSLEIGIGADSSQSARRQSNDAAYDLYLRGRYAAERGDADGMANGITYLQQALDSDPSFADAAVALAYTYYQQSFNGLAPSSIFEASRRAAESALRLNPRLGLAHAILGGIHNDYDWDWAIGLRQTENLSKRSLWHPMTVAFWRSLRIMPSRSASWTRPVRCSSKRLSMTHYWPTRTRRSSGQSGALGATRRC